MKKLKKTFLFLLALLGVVSANAISMPKFATSAEDATWYYICFPQGEHYLSDRGNNTKMRAVAFNSTNAGNKWTLIGTKEIIKEYPASEKKLDKACKKLLTDARKLLREKSINCEEREFRNGHKFLDYTDGEYPDSPVQLNLRIELWTLAEAEIRTKLRRDEKRERLESYPDFDDYCYRYIRSQINRRLEIEEGSVIEKTIEKVAPGLFDRALYEHLYEIAKGNDKNLTFGDCLNRIAYSVCAVVTSPTLFEYGEDAHLRSIGAK